MAVVRLMTHPQGRMRREGASEAAHQDVHVRSALGRGGGELRSWGVKSNCEKLRENCGKIAENCGKLRENCGKIAMS